MKNASKRIIVVLLALVMFLGIIPAAAFAATLPADTTENVVYLSVSFDGVYKTNKTGGKMNHVQIPMSKLQAIDLNKYDGMADYIYDADEDGKQDITVLHLLIYAHENLYGETKSEKHSWSEVSVSGASGSCFFGGGLWGFDMNMTYNVNGSYPLYEDGYTTLKTDDYSSMFYGGELLVWSEGIWMKAAVVDAGVNFEMYPAVCFDPSTCKEWMSSHNFVQFADEERTEEEDLAVAKFINFMGENSLTWAKDAGQVPAHVSLNAVEEYASMPQAFLSDPERVDELAIYYYLHWGLFDTAFSRVGWDFVDGTISIDDAIAQIEQEVTDAIAAQ